MDPRIVKGQWTDAEDEVIVSMQRQIGNKWAQIAQVGRTAIVVSCLDHEKSTSSAYERGASASAMKVAVFWFLVCLLYGGWGG